MNDPIPLFQTWLDEAKATGMREPTAMSVSTVDADGNPDARMLLLKGVDQRGFVFYTNLESPKAQALRLHPRAALCFYWMPLGKQVRVRGTTEAVTAALVGVPAETRQDRVLDGKTVPPP